MARTWMSTATLRAYALSGVTLDEISERNEQATGWRPDKSTVSKKLASLGIEPRNQSHRDLIPWTIRPEHERSRFRLMLQAVSRDRSGRKLSASDERAKNLLWDLLIGRGVPLVVGYHPEIGFYLTDKTDADEDIIREPRRPLDLELGPKELAAQALAAGYSPEALEDVGQNRAADLLRELQSQPRPDAPAAERSRRGSAVS